MKHGQGPLSDAIITAFDGFRRNCAAARYIVDHPRTSLFSPCASRRARRGTAATMHPPCSSSVSNGYDASRERYAEALREG